VGLAASQRDGAILHGPPGQRWKFASGNDSWGIGIEGLNGTDHLRPDQGRIDIDLTMVGHDRFGVFLSYLKLAGGHGGSYCSKGDLSRLKEWVRTKHGDFMPIGLFIPFESAWRAVKEFMDTEGELPHSIEWIAAEDIPNGVFPNQWEDVPFHK